MIYYMDVSNLDYIKLQKYVSKERLFKVEKYRFIKDKKLSIGAYLLLIYALNQNNIKNPIFKVDNYNKPYLANYPNIHFNISHSEDFVCCGINNHPIGVDIEKISEIDLTIAKKYFFKEEYEYVMESEDSLDAFFKMWVLKESYMKMTGLGFKLALDDFKIDIGDKIEVSDEKNENDLIQFKLWDINNQYKIAISSIFDDLNLIKVELNTIINYFKNLK